MKIEITGASNFVNRMFEACGPYQWAREFLKNAIEAEANRVEFGIEWQAVERLRVYRRMVADDGCGMGREELREFFSTLGTGKKKIGTVHDNFGVGAKIASLPWNPNGVVVISYKNGKASMIWIVLDEDTGDYELREFQDSDGSSTVVVDPTEIAWDDFDEIDWGALKPEWIGDHGTVIALLGSDAAPNTVLGNPDAGEADIKGLSVYLNSRFWDLAPCQVAVQELRSSQKNRWPAGAHDRDDKRRPNTRTIRGAKHWLVAVDGENGKLADRAHLMLDEGRVRVEWYLWEGERPAIHSYAKKNGYIAVRYRGELFELTSKKAHFRWFGLIESEVQKNVTLIIEPQLSEAGNGRWGVHPDQSRNRLNFTGNGQKGVSLPLSDWGEQFADDLPEPIVAAIRAVRRDIEGTIEDEEYRKRLQDRFGDRWKHKTLVKSRHEKKVEAGTVRDREIQTFATAISVRPKSKTKRKKTLQIVRKQGTSGGPDNVVEQEVPVDVPRWQPLGKDSFENDWHVAMWAPNDPAGPTVFINLESPLLEEVVAYHQKNYAPHMAEDVQDIVHRVFGEVAVAKIAHSRKLIKGMSEEEIDRTYRSEQALTLALMGLMAEESLIAQRLTKLGRRKRSA